MADHLASAFCFYLIWLWCRYTTLCEYPCVNRNRRFHITISSGLLDRLLLYHPEGGNQRLMGAEGIISYLTLIPSALYLWVRDGSFLFFDPTGKIISWWFTILFFGEVGLFTLDFWLGYLLVRRRRKKAEQTAAATPREEE